MLMQTERCEAEEKTHLMAAAQPFYSNAQDDEFGGKCPGWEVSSMWLKAARPPRLPPRVRTISSTETQQDLSGKTHWAPVMSELYAASAGGERFRLLKLSIIYTQPGFFLSFFLSFPGPLQKSSRVERLSSERPSGGKPDKPQGSNTGLTPMMSSL